MDDADEERARILRDLENYAARAPAGPRGGDALTRAIQYMSTRPAAPPPSNESNIGELITKETLRVLQTERDHELARDETQSDHEYIDYIKHIKDGRFQHIARMIALVARYAGELPHDLIHPSTRQLIHKEVDTSDTKLARNAKVEQMCDTYQWTWEDFVDPGLAGNARIACYDIGQELPRLRALNLDHVMNTMTFEPSTEYTNMFTDYFCAVVAARWRANSVLAAQPYKTKNEQAAVMVALHESSKRLCEYALSNQRVLYMPREHPTTLAELRGRASYREERALLG